MSEDIVANNGSIVELTCEANGIPDTLDYTWRKNGVQLTDGNEYTGADTSKLTIEGLTTREIGSYECYPTNTHGNHNSSTTVVSVQGKNR